MDISDLSKSREGLEIALGMWCNPLDYHVVWEYFFVKKYMARGE